MERRRKPLPRRPAYCAPFSSGCPPAKKRKRLGTTSQEPWAGAAGGDEGGVDRISALPDELLGEIISLLPTKDGACTQILASRWRHLWLSAPLNLDCRDLATAVDLAVVKYHRVYNNALSAVAHIFSLHQGSGRRFRVKGYRLPLAVAATAAALDCWLVAPALDGLQVLECWVYYKNCRPLGPLPASAYRFSPTLRVATFGGCHLPDDHIAQGLHFPNLKHLSLEYVSTSEHSLHSLIAGCPALECLMIYTSFGFRRLRINSVTLTFICVQDQVENCKGFTPLQFEKLIIENAPRLEKLIPLYLYRGLQVSGLRADSLTTAVRTVKILAVNVDILSLDNVLDMMRFFPCLEKLHVKTWSSGEKNLWHRKHQDLLTCLDIRLRTVVLETYLGSWSQVNFAKFFLLNARVLESMTFHVEASLYDEEFLAEQRGKLQLGNKASRDAQFHFTTATSLEAVWESKHLSDLNLNDPFLCRC
ncbi:F-box/FBD/LRR-repeat protein At5g53840-like [Triticum dicoccoides]|uniref:F-box/FBD/LRR-repeat protein At5g53840-like n=1 Tax=Triticum dicoccoides TaxID=85692 RepID=UPI001890E8FD|nr:F-box/FBD/LRR-repeat protein At5g53840-like [Triticum dicoccoides]